MTEFIASKGNPVVI